MKRPNGAGSVVKLKGNRRRPYEARVTVGRDHQGRQKIKAVGYYATRDEAMAALISYNRSPYDIDVRSITMAELFERWHKRATEQGRLAPRTISNVASVYNKHCASLHGKPYAAIKAHMMQSCVDDCGGGHGVQNTIKQLFYQLDTMAIKDEIVQIGYSSTITTAPKSSVDIVVFSDIEVARLWDHAGDDVVDTVLILIYSGWRPRELLELKKDDVYIDPAGETPSYMRGGIKTKAGKNRIVPIHRLISPIIANRIESHNDYIVERDGKPVTYDACRGAFDALMRRLDMRHTMRDTRRTFRTLLDRTSASISCINRIMGHTCGDVGLQNYTRNTIAELSTAVNMIETLQITKRRAVSGA